MAVQILASPMEQSWNNHHRVEEVQRAEFEVLRYTRLLLSKRMTMH